MPVIGGTTIVGGLVSAGTQSASLGNVVLANSNGVTFGMSANTVTASYTTPAQSVQPGIQALSAGTQSATTGTVIFSNSNGLSFGIGSGASTSILTGSYTVPTFLGGLAASSQSALTVTANTVNFSNANGVSFGLNSGANSSVMTASVAAQSVQPGIAGLAAGGSTATTGSVLFNNANGISFGFQAGASSTNITASYTSPAVGNAIQNVGSVTSSGTATSQFAAQDHVHAGLNSISVAGNTTGGNTTAGAGSLVLAGGPNITLSGATAAGGMTLSISGNAAGTGAGIQALSAGTQSANNATEVFANSNGVSFGMNAGTITASVAANLTHSSWNPYQGDPLVAGQQGQKTLHVQPYILPINVQFDRFVMPVVFSNASNSSNSFTASISVGIYTKNVSSLSLVTSASQSVAFTASGTAGSYSQFGGPRLFTVPLTTTLTKGDYWIGVISSTATGGGAGMSLSQYLASQNNSNFSGIFGAASAASEQQTLGLGAYSVTQAAIPNSFGFSDIVGTASIVLRPPSIYMQSGTI